jgi:hypothetical protein
MKRKPSTECIQSDTGRIAECRKLARSGEEAAALSMPRNGRLMRTWSMNIKGTNTGLYSLPNSSSKAKSHLPGHHGTKNLNIVTWNVELTTTV